MTRVWEALARSWNWKAALVSAVCRALIFFAANLAAGPPAAARAMLTEFLYRAVAAGFYGSMTQAFSRCRPGAVTNAIALVIIPGVAHALEFAVHSMAGTPMLAASMAGSVAFSMLTTLFNLHAMRRGALIVGAGSRPLSEDLRRMPSMVMSFAAASVAVLRGCLR